MKNTGIIVFVLVGVLVIFGLLSNNSTPSSSDDNSDTYRNLSSDYEPAGTFKGYSCTNDCSGHHAGYEWAEEKGITDADDCGGSSNSFIEGCIAYAEEN